jgi:dienelactone hydrolase
MVEQRLTVLTPEGAGPFPVVIYYQGTGGNDRRALSWANWFKTVGVAAAIVDNAGLRQRPSNPTGSRYTEDAAAVWDLLNADDRIDTARFALMGFSRGGGMALNAGHHFGDERSIPDFVFALYPGGFGRGRCPTNHESRTQVHIFFGDKDDVARADSLWGACRSTAKWNDNVTYHALSGATHGYDDDFGYSFSCCRPPVKVSVVPNEDAVKATRTAIAQAIRSRWN